MPTCHLEHADCTNPYPHYSKEEMKEVAKRSMDKIEAKTAQEIVREFLVVMENEKRLRAQGILTSNMALPLPTGEWLRSVMAALLEHAIEEMPKETIKTDSEFGGYVGAKNHIRNTAIADCIATLRSIQERI